MTTAITALPFYGGTLACFDGSAIAVTESSGAGLYNSTYATCALIVPPGDRATSPTWPSASTFWCRFDLLQDGLPFDPVSNGFNMSFQAAGVTVLQVLVSGETSMTFTIQTRQGAGPGTLITAGSFTVPTFSAILNTFAIGVTAGASGTLTVTSGGTLAFPTVTGLDHTAWSGVTQIVLGAFGDAFGGATSAAWSQIICDTSPTVGQFLRYDRLNTNGAVQDWTGSVSDINEIPTSDASFITVTTSNQVSVFYESGQSLTGFAVIGRGVGARMRVQTTNPPNIKLVLRVGTTNFASTAVVATAAFQAAFNSWRTNPETGLAWTSVNAAGVQSGVESSS